MNQGLIKLLGALAIVFGIYFLFQNIFSSNYEGNGIVDKKEIELSKFNKIKAEGVFQIILTESISERVEVEADENLMDKINVEVENETLKISMSDGNIKTKNPIKIYVLYKELESINTNTVGKISAVKPIKSSTFKIKKDGVGKMTLPIECDKVSIENDGVGEIELHGKAKDATIKNLGVGNVDAIYLETETAQVINDGVGSVKVNASQTLHLENKGVGSIEYNGDGEILSQTNSGVGKIKKMD